MFAAFIARIICLFKGHEFSRKVPVWVDFEMDNVVIEVCERCGGVRIEDN